MVLVSECMTLPSPLQMLEFSVAHLLDPLERCTLLLASYVHAAEDKLLVSDYWFRISGMVSKILPYSQIYRRIITVLITVLTMNSVICRISSICMLI